MKQSLGKLRVDFVCGAVAHRLRFGGGRGQALAKAMGLRAGKTPSVIDATAGLGALGESVVWNLWIKGACNGVYWMRGRPSEAQDGG